MRLVKNRYFVLQSILLLLLFFLTYFRWQSNHQQDQEEAKNPTEVSSDYVMR